jgi:(1->4)-alpha-D-glucan 1-alpha-D-glucosylmutase
LLQLRREKSELFRQAGYLPLAIEGPAAEHAVAFARIHDDEAVLVVVARLTCTLCKGDAARWSPELWRDTRTRCGAEGGALRRFRRWRNWLTGAETGVTAAEEEPPLDLTSVFAAAGGLPFAILVAQAEAA